MHKEIERRARFIYEMFDCSEYHISYYWAGPLDIYLKDMGLSLHRTNNFISEYFGVYRPDRLKQLHTERRIKAETGSAPSHWYFGFEHFICLILLLICLFFIF